MNQNAMNVWIRSQAAGHSQAAAPAVAAPPAPLGAQAGAGTLGLPTVKQTTNQAMNQAIRESRGGYRWKIK